MVTAHFASRQLDARLGNAAAQPRACVVDKGSPWVEGVATDGTACQQITAAPPGKCQ